MSRQIQYTTKKTEENWAFSELYSSHDLIDKNKSGFPSLQYRLNNNLRKLQIKKMDWNLYIAWKGGGQGWAQIWVLGRVFFQNFHSI